MEWTNRQPENIMPLSTAVYQTVLNPNHALQSPLATGMSAGPNAGTYIIRHKHRFGQNKS